jgi:hypothetical protein
VPLVTPNHMMPIGTHATEGSDCRPDRIGWIAARNHGLRAIDMPITVPITTEITKPSTPRETESQIAWVSW